MAPEVIIFFLLVCNFLAFQHVQFWKIIKSFSLYILSVTLPELSLNIYTMLSFLLLNFFFFCGTEILTWDLTLARQLEPCPQPFLL
jgi:hypothetical protein